jgi:hypothetical protein
MSMSDSLDPVPAPVRALMQLLAGELQALRFPDVDGESLAAAAGDVEAAADAVADADAALETARQRLGEQQEALLTRAHRAFGYLRVFAEGDAQLEARLEPIALPRRTRAVDAAAATGEPMAKRRGRPPKGEKADKGAPLLAGMRDGDATTTSAATIATPATTTLHAESPVATSGRAPEKHEAHAQP